ncbi:MAG: hypothetical protein IJW45_02370 [Oscillospiraceae bacterium]|nr:hypothetical protein [Oscillospiraceae bacterium]
MIQPDTIKLLRECDAGIKMGIASIEDVEDRVESDDFRKALHKCKRDHQDLQSQIQRALSDFQDQGKDPNLIAKGMSKMKTNLKLSLEPTDSAIAELMTDGCDMGIKSLSRYLNQYEAADERTKDIAKKLIKQEEDLAANLRQYL